MTDNNLHKPWEQFVNLCAELGDAQQLERVLELFLTYEEQADVAKRLLIVRELLRGDKTQRQIAKELNVSIVKITRGSNVLKQMDEEFKAFLRQSLQHDSS